MKPPSDTMCGIAWRYLKSLSMVAHYLFQHDVRKSPVTMRLFMSHTFYRSVTRGAIATNFVVIAR